MSEPHIIQNDWPGKEGMSQLKVPTCVTYHNKKRKLSSWGFLCEDPEERFNPRKTCYDWFKLFLDPACIQRSYDDKSQKPGFTTEDVQQWYKDYLRELYKHIKESMNKKHAKAWAGTVEFVFSTPTTWNPAIVDVYRNIIREAGFGTEKHHSSEVTLTEPQAAAVYTSKEQLENFEVGEVILVCDAGGGTTDLALLEMTSVEDEKTQLKEIGKVSGLPAGSTQIDKAFTVFAQSCVERVIENHPKEAKSIRKFVVSEMTMGDFQSLKCRFGARGGNLSQWSIAIPGLSSDFSDPDCSIEEGKLIMTSDQMTEWFDAQINLILTAIDKKLDELRMKDRRKQVNHLVLSGGLGSSRYLERRLEKRYISGASASKYSNVRHLKIIRAEEPQVCVARGLVLNRMQALDIGHPVLKSRYCRANYGFLSIREYDPKEHMGLEVFNEPKDGKYYAKKIEWVVKKGDVLTDRTKKSIPCMRKVGPDDSLSGWRTTIVMSYNDKHDLPKRLDDPNLEHICDVISDLSDFSVSDFELHEKPWFRKGERHYVAKYRIEVEVGAADIKFELWFNGKNCSKSNDTIEIKWDAKAAARPVDPEYRDIIMSDDYEIDFGL